MKNNNLYLLFFLLLSLIMIACKGDKSENREKIPQINDFLKFPLNMPVYILSKGHKGIEDIDISDKYKIVLYVDSFECTTCYLKLYLWNELIKQANNDLKDKIKGLGDPTVDLIIWDKYKQVVNNNY